MRDPFRDAVSIWLGYASIACWLGAQFPQLVVNWRNQSADGLALPFLLNWLLGDITNLIGCILTHQLPFQTYIAVYFCLVDFSLFAQYFYYDHFNKRKRALRRRLSSSYLSHSRVRASRTQSRSWSVERSTPGTIRALGTAAANVAQAAAALEASYVDHHIDHHQHDQHHEREHERDVLTESVISETSARRVTWSVDSLSRPASRAPTRSPVRRVVPQLSVISATPVSDASPLLADDRGRSPGGIVDAAPDADEGARREERRRRSSRASRRSASIVFLGTWALIGVVELQSQRASTGSVLASTWAEPPAIPDVPLERVIGRIAAWICTTLYLTSRLPQIWKNFVRKSTEGLSMALFTFAFLGNAFYVASILTAPELLDAPSHSARDAFLRESVPYLLGSGGTLIFDVTIVLQSFVYRPRGDTEMREEERLLG